MRKRICQFINSSRLRQVVGQSPSPSQDDLKIMEIAPYDFFVDHNYYDSDAVMQNVEISRAIDATPRNSVSEPLTIVETISISPTPPKQDIAKQLTNNDKKNQKISDNRDRHNNMKKSIVDSNLNYKKRHLEILQVEHEYNIRIAQLKIEKLELEITLLKKNHIDV